MNSGEYKEDNSATNEEQIHELLVRTRGWCCYAGTRFSHQRIAKQYGLGPALAQKDVLRGPHFSSVNEPEARKNEYGPGSLGAHIGARM